MSGAVRFCKVHIFTKVSWPVGQPVLLEQDVAPALRQVLLSAQYTILFCLTPYTTHYKPHTTNHTTIPQSRSVHGFLADEGDVRQCRDQDGLCGGQAGEVYSV